MSSTFHALGVPADLCAILAARGITEPYPIQTAAVPDALAGHDVSAQSPTGSGKTLAFGIPLVARVAATGRVRSKHPRALVLAPTRELAAQIANELIPLAQAVGRRVATFYGGVGFTAQFNALNRGVDIAVGCPGRLIDLRDRGALRLADVEVAVVDEADRMADMGFLPPLRSLLDETRRDRQTLLFSATLQGDVDRLIREYQRDPRRHVLDMPADDLGSRTHSFWKATREQRVALTSHLVETHGSSIVFCRTKHGADRLAKQLGRFGLLAVAIHGDRSQAQRDRALELFHQRRAQVLVGTDVAARGLHIDNVECVVHFDPPEDESAYVHRSGRTGRAGRDGVVVSLVTDQQVAAVRKIQQALGMPKRFDDLPDITFAEPVGVAVPLLDATPERPRSEGPQRPSGRPPFRPGERGQGGRARRSPGTGERAQGGARHQVSSGRTAHGSGSTVSGAERRSFEGQGRPQSGGTPAASGASNPRRRNRGRPAR